jgi:hypothetical protein
MRTIKLTHDEIALIQQALSMAENSYTDTQKELMGKFAQGRFVPNNGEDKQMALEYFKKGCKFADLNIEIEKGGKDV